MEKTLAIIKPDALIHSKKIINIIKRNGFSILNSNLIILSKQQAEEFYKEHKNKKFFPQLVAHLCSDFIIVMVLWRKDAIASFNKLLGFSHPDWARRNDPTSLRAQFGKNTIENALHGSADTEHAAEEINYFFSEIASQPKKIEKTLAIIKPDIIKHAREIEEIIKDEGFRIIQKHKLKLTERLACAFYQEQKDDPHFEELVDFMCSGPIEVLILERQDAVKHWKRITHTTELLISRDPSPYCIRTLFATEKAREAIHASVSEEKAQEEIQFFFEQEGPASEKTLLIIKPEANKYADEIEFKILVEKFIIIDKKTKIIEKRNARKLCIDHKDESYHRMMITQFCSGPSTILLLERAQAVEILRKLVGPWNPKIAKQNSPESLRAIYGRELYINGVYAPENSDQASRDIMLFFTGSLVDYVEIPLILEQILAIIKPPGFHQREDIIDIFIKEGLAVLEKGIFNLSEDEARLLCGKIDPIPNASDFIGGLIEAFVLGGINTLENAKKIEKNMNKKIIYISQNYKRAQEERRFLFPSLFSESYLDSSKHMEYLNSRVNQPLAIGLADTFAKKPEYPPSHLADYLKKKNPSLVKQAEL
ncbi:NME8 [Cordylochernes scorpioides]|uniref:NME8 n=1 Tax=Cordylochernes scorpioides TaxID=51811 RepID=A0ABY6K315_9ARAC|nr:NME8 [Cordylochernes scorpioides]